jgi:GntR family transcriptional regulator, phosphonate transport system regulatory protein
MIEFVPAGVSRGQGVALWRQVELALAEEIAGLAPGADRRLASEHELARRFGVNRHTVRQAVRALSERGLARVVQGRGMFAPEMVVDYRLGAETRFSANLAAQERLPERRLLGSHIREGSGELLAQLGLEPPGRVLVIETLGLADGVPLCVGLLHLSAGRFADAPHRFAGSITALYASYGIVDYRRAVTRLHARAADEVEHHLLRQPAADPIVVTESIDIDVDGRPIGLSVGRWAASRVKFTTGS